MNSLLNDPSTLSTRNTPLRSQSITQGLNERRSLSRQRSVEDRVHPTDVLQPDESPPLSALNLPTTRVLHPRYMSPLETNLASPPGGPEQKYYRATGYGGDVIGGAASACKCMFNS
jgi:hypothetical protein